MTSRPAAVGLAVGLAVLLLLVLARFTVAATTTDRQELVAARVIRAEFGAGRLGGCFMAIANRETGGTFDPRTSNWTDHHSDGSVGSFGLFQIGALWRARGESVGAFAARMYDPAANARLAHLIYSRYGIRPWGSCS